MINHRIDTNKPYLHQLSLEGLGRRTRLFWSLYLDSDRVVVWVCVLPKDSSVYLDYVKIKSVFQKQIERRLV